MELMTMYATPLIKIRWSQMAAALFMSSAAATALAGADYELKRVDWLEPVIQTNEHPNFALTTGRAVKVRAFVTAPHNSNTTPTVEIRISQGDTVVQNWTAMTPPDATAVGTDINIASLSACYTYSLTADQVQPGLRVEMVVNRPGLSQDPTPANNQTTITPAVNPANVLYITALRLQIGDSETATWPHGDEEQTRSLIKQTLLAAYPFTDVKVRMVSAPLVSAHNEVHFGRQLGDLARFRDDDGKQGYYMGFIPKPIKAGTLGNGFQPGYSFVLRAPHPDTETGWMGTVRHEFGHNMNLSHPKPTNDCTTIAELDPDIAYYYDVANNQILDATQLRNGMSYCYKYPGWITATNYWAVQQRLRNKPLDTPRPESLHEWK